MIKDKFLNLNNLARFSSNLRQQLNRLEKKLNDRIDTTKITSTNNGISILNNKVSLNTVNNLIDGGINKPLSAEQGKILKGLITAINVPKNSPITNVRQPSFLEYNGTLSAQGDKIASGKKLYNPVLYLDGIRIDREFYKVNKEKGLIELKQPYAHYDVTWTIEDTLPNNIKFSYPTINQLMKDDFAKNLINLNDVIEIEGKIEPNDGYRSLYKCVNTRTDYNIGSYKYLQEIKDEKIIKLIQGLETAGIETNQTLSIKINELKKVADNNSNIIKNLNTNKLDKNGDKVNIKSSQTKENYSYGINMNSSDVTNTNKLYFKDNNYIKSEYGDLKYNNNKIWHSGNFDIKRDVDAKINKKFNKDGGIISGNVEINTRNPKINFNDNRDSGIEVSVGVEDEHFYIREPEEGDQEWFRIEDEGEAYLHGKKLWHEGNFNPNRISNSSHDHDNRYHTKNEINSKLSTINSKIDGIAVKTSAKIHTHDDRYFTKSETNLQHQDIRLKMNNKLEKSGDILTIKNDQYFTSGKYGINMKNSDIVGLNALHFNDYANDPSEGIAFPRSGSGYDYIWAQDYKMKFNNNVVWHEGNFNPKTKADANHEHDSRYFKKNEVDEKLNEIRQGFRQQKVGGHYSGDGGKQPPSYLPMYSNRFLMSNEVVNGNGQYKDWIYMNSYNNSDVPACTAIGVNKVENDTVRCFIMSGSPKGSDTWNNKAELWSNLTFNPDTKADKNHTHNDKLDAHDFKGKKGILNDTCGITAGWHNEINFATSINTGIWLNYRQLGPKNSTVLKIGNGYGKGGYGDIWCNLVNPNRVLNAVYNDYAELFPKEKETKTEVGDIVGLSSSDGESYEKATKDSLCLVGVHSDSYGILIGGNDNRDSGKDLEEFNKDTHIPVGLCGRVYVKFIGIAKKGMKVTISDIAGIGKEFNPKEDTTDVIGVLVEDNYDHNVKKVKMFIK